MAKKLFVKLQTPTIELKVAAKDASKAQSEILVGFKRYTVEQLQKKFDEVPVDSPEADFEFLQKEIIYIKNAVLEVYDENDNYLEDLVIKDTRIIEKNEFFQDSSEALVVLLKHYMNSNPWKNSLFEAYKSALVNMSFEEAELKN